MGPGYSVIFCSCSLMLTNLSFSKSKMYPPSKSTWWWICLVCVIYLLLLLNMNYSDWKSVFGAWWGQRACKKAVWCSYLVQASIKSSFISHCHLFLLTWLTNHRSFYNLGIQGVIINRHDIPVIYFLGFSRRQNVNQNNSCHYFRTRTGKLGIQIDLHVSVSQDQEIKW